MAISEAFGRQLRMPTGIAGRLTGLVMSVANRRPNRLAIDALRIRPHDRILELGFGPGLAIKEMASLARRGTIYGVDASPVMLDQARKRNASAIHAGRVWLYRAPFDALPLPDASIDGILAVNVAYFWDDTVAVIREMRRVLRPGGRVSIYATDSSAMRKWKFAGPQTHRLFDASDLATSLGEGGFDPAAITLTRAQITSHIVGFVVTINGQSSQSSQAFRKRLAQDTDYAATPPSSIE